MKRTPQRNIPLKFDSYYKVVSLHYPDDIEGYCTLEFCGTHWENLLQKFFKEKQEVIETDCNNGLTSQAIEIFFKYETPDETIKTICEQAIDFILKATIPKFTKGMVVTFNTTQSNLLQYNNQDVTIQRLLSEEECDIDEVGYMYEVMNFNGNKFQAFQDELN